MNEVSLIMRAVFGGIWDLFSGVTLPLLNITAAQAFIGFFVIKFSLNLLALVTGFRSNVGAAGESVTRSRETLNHYSKLKEQKENYKRNGGIGFH